MIVKEKKRDRRSPGSLEDRKAQGQGNKADFISFLCTPTPQAPIGTALYWTPRERSRQPAGWKGPGEAQQSGIRAPDLCLHVQRLYISCTFTGETQCGRIPGTKALLEAEVADVLLRPTRGDGHGEGLRGSLLGREVDCLGHSSLGRGGPPEDRLGRPDAVGHTLPSALLLGPHPNSPPAALSGRQGPGKNRKEA